jgi:Flp pilus assembly protein TadG
MKTGDTLKKARGFLSRLSKDQSGNTLAMVAAGVIPFIGVVGGAVDMSRSYMAKARLQQACDAGALAARSAMTGATLQDAEKAVGYQYFDFNYPQGSYETTNLVRTYTQPTSNNGVAQPLVRGNASVDVPTTLMRIFGNEEIELSVTCLSKKDVSNADVVMVLDVTFSMESQMKKTAGQTATESRISALRRSVAAFYNSLGAGRANGDTTKGRIRYGFVPYGTNVNAGYLLTHAQMVDSHNYSTRGPISNTLYSWTETLNKPPYVYSPANVPSSVVTASQNANNYSSYGTSVTGTGNGSFSYTRLNESTNSLPLTVTTVPKSGGGTEAATSSNCYKANAYVAGTSNSAPGLADVRLTYNTPTETRTELNPPPPVYLQTTRNVRNWSATRQAVSRGLRYRWFSSGGNACRLELATGSASSANWTQTAAAITETGTISWLTHNANSGFIYQERTIDVSGYKGSGSSWNTTINVPNLNISGGTWSDVKLSGSNDTTRLSLGGVGTPASVTWLGCVEERSTDNTISGSTPLSPVPANARDLNVKTLSSNYATKWRPWIPPIFFTTTGQNYRSSSSDRSLDESCAGPALKLQEYASYSGGAIQTATHNYPMLFDSVSGGASSYFYPYQSTASKNTATIQNYIDRIPMSHGTTHDAGFIWGLHLLSGQGMFASENPDYFNGNLVNRNLVFMTDGDLNPGEERYVYSGFNQVDGRIAPRSYTDSQMKVVHNRRLRILCESAKAQGITVWVVVIKDGVSQDTDLRLCASSDAHFKTAETADELVQSYSQIATSIGGLRLTQ